VPCKASCRAVVKVVLEACLSKQSYLNAMLQFYVKLAAILYPFRKLIAVIGIVALFAMVMGFAGSTNESSSAIIFLFLSVALLSLMLYSASQYFLDFPISIKNTKGMINRLRFRIRLSIAWIFAVAMSLVIIKIIFLSLRLVKLV